MINQLYFHIQVIKYFIKLCNLLVYFIGTASSHLSSLPIGLSGIFQSNGQINIPDIFIYNYTQNCNIHAFVGFDNNFNINNVSLSTDCMAVNIGTFYFKDVFHQIIILHGSFNPTPSKSLIIKSQLQSVPFYQLNKFLTMYGVLEITYDALNSNMDAVINSVNISIFNATISTSIDITNPNVLSFQEVTKIYNDYDISVQGSLLSNHSDWQMVIDGEFLSINNKSFHTSIISYLSQHLRTELSDVSKKGNRTIQAIALSEKWLNKLYEELNQTKFAIEQAMISLNTSNQSYIHQVEQHQIAKETLLKQLNLKNITNPCPISLCNSVCITGVNCSPITETTNFNVTGSCLVKSLAYETVKISHTVPSTEWLYKRNCNFCWKVLWYNSLYLSQEQCCVESKVPVQVHHESVQYVHKAINITTRTSCITAIYNEPTTSIDCNVDPCLYEASNHHCNLKCYQESLLHYSNITQLYINTTLSVLSSQKELVRNQIHVSQLLQQLSLLQTAISNANESYYINLRANKTLITENGIFTSLLNLMNSSLLTQKTDVVQITNISFKTVISSATPTSFPIKIDYSIPLTPQSSSVELVVNFLQPQQHILREISSAILESYLNLKATNKRRKRDTEGTPSVYYFHNTCIELKSMKNYISQILNSLKYSYQHLNISKHAIQNANRVLFNANLTDVINGSNWLKNFFINNSFALWQVQMEIVNINVSSVESFACSSYLDCLENVVALFKDILQDSKNGENIFSKVNNMEETLLRVGYDKQMSYEEAYSVLSKFSSLLVTPHIVDYWCTKPPKITKHPPANVQVPLLSKVTLTCSANSSSHVNYYWTKDNIILPFSNSPHLTLTNSQSTTGGVYQCIAVNDAGSTVSLPTIVQIVIPLKFNQTIPSLLHAYINDENAIHLSCDASGFPSPGWVWFYRQNNWENWYEINNVHSNVYTLIQPQTRDKGWYQCMAYTSTSNITSTPIYLDVFSTSVPRVQYTVAVNFFTTPYIKINQQITNNIVRKLTTLARIFYVPSEIIYSSNFSLIQFSIQTSSINSLLPLTSIISMMSSNIKTLETDKSSLNSTVYTNQLNSVTLSGKQYLISDMSIDFGPRTFICPSGYGLLENRVMCGKFNKYVYCYVNLIFILYS